MKNNGKGALIFVLVLGLVFVVFVPETQADVWGSIGAGAMGLGLTVLTQGLNAIVFLMMHILALGIGLGGMLFDWFLGWKITNLPIITEGWKIIRDFTNVSFIFLLLTIAISTILGIEKYGAKKLFVNLVIIALLVNFSLLLVTTVLDASFLLTKFLIEESGVSGLKASEKLASALGIGKLWDVASNSQGFVAGAVNMATTMLISMIMGTVVLLATFIVIWLATGLLLVRAIILAVIAIFAPAAFLCRIIPGTEKYWQKWWSTLINWALFPPAFAFFLYLAMRTADSFNEFKSAMGGAPDFEATVSSFFSMGNQLIQYILVLGFTLGGLLMAKQFGVYGGAKIYGLGSKALKAASGYSWAGKKGKAAWATAKTKAARYSGIAASKLISTTAKIPGINRLTRPVSQRLAIEAAIQERKGNKAIIDKYKDWTEEELGRYWNHLSKRERAVILADKAEKKKAYKLGLDEPVIVKATTNMPKYQVDYEEVFKYMPSVVLDMPIFYEKNRQDIDQISEQQKIDLDIAKIEFAFSKMGSSDLTGMKAEDLTGKVETAFIKALANKLIDKRHIASIMASDNSKLIRRVADIINGNLGEFPQEFQNYWNASFVQGLGFPAPTTPTPTPTPTPAAPAAGGGTP